jgi:hypothetical protein
MRRDWLIAALALATLAAPAQAQDQSRRQWPSESQTWMPHIPDCTCRAQGRDFQVGEGVCIGSRRATCGMVLNNTSWIMSSEPCATSALPGLQLAEH